MTLQPPSHNFSWRPSCDDVLVTGFDSDTTFVVSRALVRMVFVTKKKYLFKDDMKKAFLKSWCTEGRFNFGEIQGRSVQVTVTHDTNGAAGQCCTSGRWQFPTPLAFNLNLSRVF